VHKVSIIPRGIGALGYTIQRPTEDRYLMSAAELEHKIAVLLGGRAAEKLIFGQLSTGAADDLAKATQIAREMVTRYGMNENLGYVTFETRRNTMPGMDIEGLTMQAQLSPATLEQIDHAIRSLVMENFERALALLSHNRVVLERCAQALLQKETLESDELKLLTQDLNDL
jgi:cell division protease FtsH